MDRGLTTLLLLALCTLTMTEQIKVPAEPATENEPKSDDASPKYKTVTLNVTICIPKHGNNDTKFIMTSQILKEDTILFTAAAERPGPKTACNVSSCGQDHVPELAVYIFHETPKKRLICSGNVTNEDLFVTMNATTSEISYTPKRIPGNLNSAIASVQLIVRDVDSLHTSNSDNLVSFTVTTKQLLIPTTTTIPTTTVIPPSKKNVVTTNKVTSKETTKASTAHVTMIQKTTQKPSITKKPIILPHNGSSLVRSSLWGMGMLVLIQIFLN